MKACSWVVRVLYGGLLIASGLLCVLGGMAEDRVLFLPAALLLIAGVRIVRSGVTIDQGRVVVRGLFRTVQLPLEACRFRPTSTWVASSGSLEALVVITPSQIVKAWLVTKNRRAIASTVAEFNAAARRAGRRRPDSTLTPAGFRVVTAMARTWVLQPDYVMGRAAWVIVLGTMVTTLVERELGWVPAFAPIVLSVAAFLFVLRQGISLSSTGLLTSFHGFSTTRWGPERDRRVVARRSGADSSAAWLEMAPDGDPLKGLVITAGNEQQVANWLNRLWGQGHRSHK